MSRILIIDDDETNRHLLRTRLELGGHSITETVNGEEGLRAIDAEQPDIVILDVMMPKMDGWAVCRKIRDNPKTKMLPIIMLTAMGDQIDQLRSWESGVNEYMSKPWNPEKMLQIVDKYRIVPESSKEPDRL